MHDFSNSLLNALNPAPKQTRQDISMDWGESCWEEITDEILDKQAETSIWSILSPTTVDQHGQGVYQVDKHTGQTCTRKSCDLSTVVGV